ncbi:hypothetical protein [Streptomyces sp. NPDC007100]|uniref:hypothetical protein n=1 Tax=Streptomyces sp. NPDC007100 TaxID=3155602 RepID=UPI00340A88A9
MALIEFGVSYTPEIPRVTVEMKNLSSESLTLQGVETDLTEVKATAKNEISKVLEDYMNDLVKQAPGSVNEAIKHLSHTVEYQQKLGATFPVKEGVQITVELTSPAVGQHDGKLMISGETQVS